MPDDIVPVAVISASLLAAYQKGHGEPYADGTFVNPSDKQQQPASMDTYLYQEYHLLTDGQYHIGGQLKYAFLFPATRLKTYARLHMQYRKSVECNYDDYTTVTFAIGCNF